MKKFWWHSKCDDITTNKWEIEQNIQNDISLGESSLGLAACVTNSEKSGAMVTLLIEPTYQWILHT